MGNRHLIPVDLWKMVCEWNPSELSNPRSKGAEALFFNSQAVTKSYFSGH